MPSVANEKWYETLVVVVTPAADVVVHVSSIAFDPVRCTFGGQELPHGEPAGLVSTVTAEARSAGTHMPMVCSARATLKRPSVLFS